MPCSIRELSVLAYAQGFTLWHYRANIATLAAAPTPPVTLATASELGFFDDARDMLAPGDMIVVSARDGCGALWVAGTGGSVTTAALGQTLPEPKLRLAA
jgi:hypothetical protein